MALEIAQQEMDTAEADDTGRHKADDERRYLRRQIPHLCQTHHLEQPRAEDDGGRKEETEAGSRLPP